MFKDVWVIHLSCRSYTLSDPCVPGDKNRTLPDTNTMEDSNPTLTKDVTTDQIQNQRYILNYHQGKDLDQVSPGSSKDSRDW